MGIKGKIFLDGKELSNVKDIEINVKEGTSFNNGNYSLSNGFSCECNNFQMSVKCKTMLRNCFKIFNKYNKINYLKRIYNNTKKIRIKKKINKRIQKINVQIQDMIDKK